MTEKCKRYWFPAAAFLLSLTASLFWVALRVNYSGISKFLGADTNPSFLVMNLPLLVVAAAWVGTGFALAGLLAWDRVRWPAAVGLLTTLVMSVGALVVIRFGARDYLPFILPHFYKSLAGAALVLVTALALYFPVANRRGAATLLKTLCVVVLALALAAIGWGWRGCRFTYDAVVYAVEDTYQIVFSTSDSAMAWVTVDGQDYYDLYAGSARSKDKVHKVTVPQAALDAAGGYTVTARQMIYRGPFGGYMGRPITREYAFAPVNTADGIDYITLSDVHGAVSAATAAASTVQNTDFVVLLGDLVSMVETEGDAQLANRLAHAVTGGSKPVIYARGNHEIKGEYAEELYKYVGSLNQSYAYTVSLAGGEIFAAVLDMGEDHEDDWWEYYGTAQFDLYRADQSAMLQGLIDTSAAKKAAYRMAICHISPVFVDEGGLFEGFRQEWTELLNAWDTHICLSGHEHKLWFFLPDTVQPGVPLEYTAGYAGESGKLHGGTVTDHDFPAFLAGRRSLQQAGGTVRNTTDYTCLHTHVDLTAGTQTCRYINSKGETLTVELLFEGTLGSKTYTEIETQLN